jgi:hypothetical protein
MFKDQKRFKHLVDPRLRGQYPDKSLNQAVAVAIMCLQDEPTSRPIMTDVIAALNHLTAPADPEADLSQQERPQSSEKLRLQPIREAEVNRGKMVADAIEWDQISRHDHTFKHERHSS